MNSLFRSYLLSVTSGNASGHFGAGTRALATSLALGSAFVACAADGGGAWTEEAQAVGSASSALSTGLVIRSLYGGSGNRDSAYARDFVEIFNRGLVPASLEGLSLQYGTESGSIGLPQTETSPKVFTLPAVTLAPGQSFLVGMFTPDSPTGGSVPAVDTEWALNLSAGGAKVALASGTEPLGCGAQGAKCSRDRIVDLVGYGRALDYEGSAAAKSPGSKNVLVRKGRGCLDTEDNATDFLSGTRAPHGAKDPAESCEGFDGSVDDAEHEEDGGTLDAGDAAPGEGTSSDLVISQVYGGGGNRGGAFARDFVELFNRGKVPVSLAGLSVQYGSAGGGLGAIPPDAGPDFTNVAPLPDKILEPGRYFLVALAEGSEKGLPKLPSPDFEATVTLGSQNGKVALVHGTDPALCGSASRRCDESAVVDLVGFGTSSDYEGSGAVDALGNDKAGARRRGGCVDTNDNRADFEVTTPLPRNGGSAPVDCSKETSDTKESSETADAGSNGRPNRPRTDAAAGLVSDPEEFSEACSCRAAGTAKREGWAAAGLWAFALAFVSRRRTRRS